MTYTLPYKTKQFFFVLIKLSIVVAAFYFIIEKLLKNPEIDFHTFKDFLYENDVFSLKNSLILLFLTIFNWFLDILKWQTLVSPIKKISFIDATEQNLASLTASLITPNRIGEYGAKAIYYKKGLRKRILLLNLMGNMMQMTVTCAFGIIGLSFFVSNYNATVIYPFKVFFIILLGAIFTGTICVIIYRKKLKIRGFLLSKIISFIIEFPKNKIYLGFLFSGLRYALFSFQFYYLLMLFNTNLNYLTSMMVITSMYFLASIVPSLSFFDAVIKGSVAMYLFGFLGINEFVILSIITIMWLLNFALPSIFGSFYVLNFKLQKGNS